MKEFGMNSEVISSNDKSKDYYKGLLDSNNSPLYDHQKLYHAGAPAPHLPARAVARELQELQNIIDYHVDPLLGVTNDYVRDFCRGVIPPELNTFLGVFPADAIPTELSIFSLPTGCMIINLGHIDTRRPHAGAEKNKANSHSWNWDAYDFETDQNIDDSSSDSPLGHFVCVQLEPEQVYYIDSFGDVCTDPCVLRFLNLCKRPVIMHRRAVQNRLSMFCSLYAILFTLRALTPKNRRFSFHWDKYASLHNDDYCVLYLRKLVAGLYQLRSNKNEQLIALNQSRIKTLEAFDPMTDAEEEEKKTRASKDKDHYALAAPKGKGLNSSAVTDASSTKDRTDKKEIESRFSPVQLLPEETDEYYASYRDPAAARSADAAIIAWTRGEEDVDCVG